MFQTINELMGVDLTFVPLLTSFLGTPYLNTDDAITQPISLIYR